MAKTGYYFSQVMYMVLMTSFMLRKVNSHERNWSWEVYAHCNGFRSTNGTFISVRSHIHCGMMCTSDSQCVSYFYTPNEYNGCQLMSQIFSSTYGLVPSVNTLYYGPAHDNYNTVVLEDGERFRYRIVQIPASNNHAENNCASDGGHLVQITSIAKLNFLRNVVSQTHSSTNVPKVCANTLSTKYVGTLDATVNGDICQNWDSQSPHPHEHTNINDFPETVLADAANFCRDPDYSDELWCMTANPSVEWDWCTMVDCATTIDIPTENCYISGNSVDYIGTWSQSKYGHVCQRWDAQSPHSHGFTSSAMFPDTTLGAANNYCRDPDGRGYTWCFTTDIGVRWEPCYVRDCIKDIPERKCYDHPSDQSYVGTWNLTLSGFICQRWDSITPHTHSYTAASFPDTTLSEAGNYCRDPDNSGYLWCFTTDPGTVFESCDIPQCDGSDGYYVQGTNQNSLNEWQVSDGVAIDSSSWGVGKPDYPNQEHCARMDSKLNWNLNDGDCTWSLWYICEKR